MWCSRNSDGDWFLGTRFWDFEILGVYNLNSIET
jgi:hypothetical protein